MKILFAALLYVVSACFLESAVAQSLSMDTPDGVMKTVTQQVLDDIKSDQQIQSGSISRITRLVNEKILPYTDFQRTTRLAMARNWNLASTQQQQQIVEQFKILLIRTYAGALAQVRDQQITYQPFRAQSDATDVVVRSVIVHNNSPIDIDYRLYKTPQGWRIYDINILGAWLIQVYQQQFGAQVSEHGVDGLLQFLTQRNQQLASGEPKLESNVDRYRNDRRDFLQCLARIAPERRGRRSGKRKQLQ
jgi:phospholipid transport system substrate-binding protein